MVTTWLSDYTVNTTTTGYQQWPDAVALSDGRFVITWDDASATGGDASGLAIRGQIYNGDGTLYGGEFLVNTATSGDQTRSTVAALPGGRFVVAWTDNSASGDDTSGSAIRAQIFDVSGGKSGSEFVVNTSTTSNQSEPTIASFANGKFVVTWTDASGSGTDASGTAIRGQVFNASGVKQGMEFQVNSTVTNNQFRSAVTTLSDGRFGVVWTDQSHSLDDPSGNAVRGQLFNGDGTLSGSEFLVPLNLASDQEDPTIAALADGRFVVAWADRSGTLGDSSDRGVHGVVYNGDGTRYSAEFLVNTGTTLAQYEPKIASLSDGRFLVAWADSRGFNHGDVWAQVLNIDGTKSGAEFRLHNYVTSNWDEGMVSLSTLPDGRVVATWMDGPNVGTDRNVKAKILDPREAGVTVVGTGGNDQLYGSTFADTLSGGAGNDTLMGGAGIDLLDGGAGNDTADFTLSTTGVIVSLSSVPGSAYGAETGYDTLKSIENVTGGSGDDVITGSTGANVIKGGGGSDIISSGGGKDTIYGGDGDDVLHGEGADDLIYGDDGQDVLNGGAGKDTLDGGSGDDVLIGDIGNDVLIGGVGADMLDGGAGADVLTIDDLDTFVFGGSGTDTLYVAAGSGGVTVNLTTAQIEKAFGGDGGDSFDATGQAYAVILDGGAGADTLTGSGRADTIYGGDGADVITGGAGADKLYGNALVAASDGDVDTFVFGTGWGKDRIFDFEDGVDQLDFSAFGAAADALSDFVVRQSGANVILNLVGDTANTVTLVNMTVGQISSDDFSNF